jgi:hypothetical protein
MVPLIWVVLINTQRVNPNEPPRPASPRLLQEIPDILPHRDPSPVDKEFFRLLCRTPGIR